MIAGIRFPFFCVQAISMIAMVIIVAISG